MHGPGVHAEHPDHLGERVDCSDAGGEHHLDVVGEEPLLLLGPCDRVDVDPAPEEQADEACPLRVLRPERIVAAAADEAERRPLPQRVHRGAGPRSQLVEREPVRHGAPHYDGPGSV